MSEANQPYPGAGGKPPSAGDRRAQRIEAAERSLAQAYADMKVSGIDLDALTIAIATARDCLAEARECAVRARDDLALAQRERLLAQRERAQATRERLAALPDRQEDPVFCDGPGAGLCPDPRAVSTPDELMAALREFWTWAGQPSYRAMARQCGSRFAASTIHTAMHSSRLCSLDMIQAIIIGCRGSTEHRQAFAQAWRRLQLPAQGAWQPEGAAARGRVLYPVSETA